MLSNGYIKPYYGSYEVEAHILYLYPYNAELMLLYFLSGGPGSRGSPGVVTEESLLSILRRPSNIQNDDSNAYEELNNIEKLVDGKSICPCTLIGSLMSLLC